MPSSDTSPHQMRYWVGRKGKVGLSFSAREPSLQVDGKFKKLLGDEIRGEVYFFSQENMSKKKRELLQRP